MLKHICGSYKKELFEGIHTPNSDYRIALLYQFPTISISSYYDIEKYEVAGPGYDKGGKKLDKITITLDEDVAILSFDTTTWAHCNFKTIGAILYNASLKNCNAVAVFNFEREYILNDADFILSFPPPDKENGFIRII